MARGNGEDEKEKRDDDAPEDDVQMGFFEHIGELRKRLIRCLWGFIPGLVGSWLYKEQLLAWIAHPFAQAVKRLGLGDAALHFLSPFEGYMAYLQICLVVALLVASPWVFWQIWAFISPGLYRREKRLALPFVLASTLFFAGGAIFGFVVVFPLGFETFLGVSGWLPGHEVRVDPMLTLDEYLSFSLKMLIAFGVVFEVPVVVTFLAAAHIVNWRQLLRFFRWWCVIAAVIAALLTPPDVGSQMLMLVPMVALYLLAIVMAAIVGPKAPKPVKPAPSE
jgi:sec-independent protein translocase protein TatC